LIELSNINKLYIFIFYWQHLA